MNSKLVSSILILIFIAIFSYFEWEDFFEHKKQTEYKVEAAKHINEKLKDFTLDSIRNLEDTTIYSTPDKELMNTISKTIEEAQERVYLEVYLLTERNIMQAIIASAKKWTDVKVILEHSPYKQIHLNTKAYDALIKAWVDVVWSNPKNYALNHSKLLIIDDEAYVSTGNMSYSTFAHNRDFFIHTKDPLVLTALEEIFLKDFAWMDTTVYSHDLLISPNYSRKKFTTMLEEAQKSIYIYAQYIKDDELFSLLQKNIEQWIDVKIILSRSWYEDFFKKKGNEKYKKFIFEMQGKPKMHAKAFLIDERYLFIWSTNFSYPSIDKNREIGMLLSNEESIKKFIEVWERDK